MPEATRRVVRSNKERLRELAERAEDVGLTIEQFEAIELGRVRFSFFMALVCEAIPRRLGRDADPWALTLDNRVARKVANVYRSIWAGLDKNSAPAWNSRAERTALAASATSAQRQAGATVKWGAWLKGRYKEIGELMVKAAALGLASKRRRWAASRVRLLEIEQEDIRRIINDVVGRAERLRERMDA